MTIFDKVIVDRMLCIIYSIIIHDISIYIMTYTITGILSEHFASVSSDISYSTGNAKWSS